jgi:iron transport multicopper oxidase
MGQLQSLNVFVLLYLLVATCVLAGIGPIATLPIVNRNLAPDGFNRSYVSITWSWTCDLTAP